MQPTVSQSKRRTTTSITLVWSACITLLAGQGCAGEASLPDPDSRGGTEQQGAPNDETVEASDSEGAAVDTVVDEPIADVPAPGIEVAAYPSGPFGTKVGATIENMELYGWRSPTAVGFDLAQAEILRFSDYYNVGATGQGVEYILLNVVASWCGVCRREYTEMATNQVYATLAPRGLEIIGVLYEDNNSDPSRFVDMSNWAQAFTVSFPFVNDPGFTTGRYFDRSATPMNMLIDARSMRIVQVGTGYRPAMFDEIDVLLQERGR